MRLLDWVSARTASLSRELADGSHAAVYLRQLVRGNHQTVVECPEPAPVAPVGAPTPVLLIHGYFATRGSLHLLEQRLRERGHLVLSYRLGLMNLGDIRESAALIARKVESVMAQSSVRTIDIVAHSMGGLVGLYYLKRLGGRHRVRKLVMLGTPMGGTWSALLGLVTAPLGRASLQLLPASPFLRDLHEGPLPPGVEVVSIAGERDHLAPVSSTVLDGVRHIALPTSHSGLLVDCRVADAVADILRASPEQSTDIQGSAATGD